MRLVFCEWANVDCRFSLKALKVGKRLKRADNGMRSELS